MTEIKFVDAFLCYDICYLLTFENLHPLAKWFPIPLAN